MFNLFFFFFSFTRFYYLVSLSSLCPLLRFTSVLYLYYFLSTSSFLFFVVVLPTVHCQFIVYACYTRSKKSKLHARRCENYNERTNVFYLFFIFHWAPVFWSFYELFYTIYYLKSSSERAITLHVQYLNEILSCSSQILTFALRCVKFPNESANVFCVPWQLSYLITTASLSSNQD